MQVNRICAATLLIGITGSARVSAQSADASEEIRAHLRPVAYHIPVGRPVWALLSVENAGAEPVTLTVPGAEPQIPEPEMGLPISHVFSGNPGLGLTVKTESGRQINRPVGYRATSAAPILILGPHSTVGTKLDLRTYFPVLRGAGQYRLTWRPYGGRVESETVLITIALRKQVEIITDDGTMTIRLFYEDAPGHVVNFLDLAQSGFYTGKTFHRLESGYMLLGGCPRGDGTGIRADGKRIPAEFSSRSHQKGSVSMALLDDDPDSASCQFFICNTRQKDWDGRYTVFGRLEGEESYETLERLMATAVDEAGRPTRTLTMRNVRVVDASPEPYPSAP